MEDTQKQTPPQNIPFEVRSDVSPVVDKVGIITNSTMDEVKLHSCQDIVIRPVNVNDKIRVWRHKLCHVDPEHPIENCHEVVGRPIDKYELVYDYELEYELRRLIVKYRQQPIRSYPRPQKIYMDRWGNEVWYCSIFTGKYKDRGMDEIYVNSWNAFDYDPKTHRQFTFGNFEYASRVTRYLWKERTKFCGRLEKKEFIRYQICYRFLCGIQDYKTGKFEELNRWTDEINEVPPQDVEAYVEEKLKQKYVGICQGKPEFLKLQTEETKTFKEYRERVKECIAEEVMVEDLVDVTPGLFAHEATVRVAEDTERVIANQPWKEPQIVVSACTIPEATTTPHRSPKVFRTPNYDPVDNPFGNLRRSYFTDLFEIYLHIGRPDLALKHQAMTVYSIRRRPKIPPRLWNHNLAAQMRNNRTYQQMNASRILAQLRPDGLQAESGDRPVVQGSCIRPARRTRILRFITNQDPLIQRHLDKMLVLCTKTPPDMHLFLRQKRIILTIDPHLLQEAVDTIGHGPEILLPERYVEQAQLIKKKILRCLINPTDDNIWVVCKLLLQLIAFWCEHEYEAWRCACVEAKCFTDMVAESAEQPPLKASPGPTPGSAKDGVTAPSTKQSPITGGEKKVTMTMVDQRDKEAVTVKDTKETPLSKATMPESLYDLEEIGKRPMLIDRLQWKASDPIGTVYKAWVMPYTYFNADSKTPTVCQNMNAAYVLSMYGIVRFDMVFRIQINSTKFQQGILKFVWKPFFDASRSKEVFDNLTTFAAADIRANESNTAEITVPWSHFRDGFPTYTDNNLQWAYLGGLGCVVWNPLQTGDAGSKDADITIWMYLKNLQVHQLTNPKPPGKVMFASTILGQKDEDTNKRKVLQEGEYRFTKKEVWEAQALVTDVVGSLVDMGADIVKDTGAELVESLLNKISGKPNCKPDMPLPPAPVMPQVMENLAHCEGIDTSSRLDVYPIAGDKPTPEQYRAINLREMSKVWTRIAVGTWKTTDDNNKSIFVCPVTPSIVSSVNDSKITFSTGSYVFEDWNPPESSCTPNFKKYSVQVSQRRGSMLDYLARMFFYWRGDIKYKIEFVGTAMHSGRLLIRYEPYGTSESAKLECEKASTPGLTWDIEEKHELVFTVPYASNQEWLQTNFLSDGYITDSQMGLSFSGLWEIVVVNKLRATAGISAQCDINVYIAAGDNFKFYQLCPLDGIIGFRNNINGDSASNESDTYFNMLSGMWVWLLQWVIKDVDHSDKHTYQTTPPVTFWIPNTRALGAGAAEEYEDPDKFYEKFVTTWEGMKTLVESWGDLHFPKFSSHTEAYNWIRMSGEILPAVLKRAARLAGVTISNIERQKIHWYLAYSLLPPDVMFTIDEFPEVPPWFGVEIATFAPDLQAESKSSKGGGINPFLTEHVSRESYNTADHMDMYRNLKRPVLWGTFQVPRPLGTSDVDNAYKIAEQKNNIFEWASLTSYERATAWWEFRIPVTPMLKFHQIGEPGHWFVADKFKGAETDRSKVYPLENGSANAEGGSKTSMTPLRYLSELFTFWHGDLRYKFIFHDLFRPDGKPWQAYIMHHPTQFTKWDPTFQNYKLVTDTRRRNMSQLGTVLFSGNVMSQVSVEVPYASMYRKLYLTDAYNQQFTDNGSLLIYIPYVTNGFEVCDPKNMTDDSVKKFGLEGLTFTVAVSIGETFEFENLRAPPMQLIWPSFWRRNVESDHVDYGWASVDLMKGDVSKVPKAEAVRRFVRGVNNGIEDYSPIHSFTKVVTLPRKLTVSSDYSEYIKKGRRFNPGMLLEWIKEPRVEPKFAEDLVAEAGEEDFVQTKPKVVDLPPKEFLRSVSVMSPEEIQEMVKEDTIDGVISSTFKAAASALLDFQETTQAIRDSTRSISNIAESVTETTQTVKSSSSIIGKATKWTFDASRMAIFFHGLTQLLKAKDWNERFLPITQCAMALGISADVITNAGRWLMDWFTGAETEREDRNANDLNAEGAWEDVWNNDWVVFLEENVMTLKLIAAAIVTFMVFYLTSRAPTSKSLVTNFASDMITKLRNFTIVSTAVKSFDWLFKWIGTVISNAAEAAGNWATGGKLVEYRMSAHYPEVIDWMKKIARYEQDEGLQHLCWDTQERFELWKRMDEGEFFLEKLKMKSGPLYNTILRGIKVLQTAHDKAQSLVEIPFFRFDPFHICLYGDAGYGKSSILNQILEFVCDEANLPQKHRYYQRNPDDDYWTNYCGQACVVIDDYQQRTDAPANKELVQMKSNQPWPLNMADMKEKGRQFSSVLVGSTTNIAFPKSDKQVCNSAIWRRRNMLLKVTSVKPGSVDPMDLRFTQLEANPTGEKKPPMEKAIPGRENMKLDQVMALAAELYVAHATLQYALVFGNLKKKVVEIDDVKEEQIQVASTPTPQNFADWMKLIAETKMDAEQIDKILSLFTDDEILEQVQEYPILQATTRYKALVAKFHAIDPAKITSKEQFATLIRMLHAQKDVEREKLLIDWDMDTNKWIRWDPCANHPSELIGSLDGYVCGRWKATIVNQKRELTHIDRAEGLFEDMIQSTEERKVMKEIAHKDRCDRARRQVKTYTESISFMQGVLQEFADVVPKKKIHLIDKRAIEDYCKRLHHLTEDQKKQMEDDIDKIYTYVNNDKLKEIRDAAKDKDFGELFSTENKMYWKQREDTKDWYMDIPAEMNDKNYELETLYDLMKITWKQEKINEMKNALPHVVQEDGRIVKFMRWCDEKKKSLMTWWESHPNLRACLKIAATLGGVFLGYKLLYNLFPGIMEQLKSAFSTMFNWVTGRSTNSRVQDVKEFLKDKADRLKIKLSDYYEMIRNMMRSSQDQEVRDMAEDEQAVHMLAESLMNKCETQAQLIKVQKAVAEGKEKVKKITSANPYIMANLTPYHPEHAEKQLSELVKEVNMPVVMKKDDLVAHGSTDLQVEVFRKSMIRNMVMISYMKNDKVMEMRAFFIRGRTLLAPSHFFLALEENDIITIRFANLIFYQIYESHRRVAVPGQDLVLYECTTQIGTFKDVTSSFITELDLDRCKRTQASLNVMTDYGVIAQYGEVQLGGEVDYKLGDDTFYCSRAWAHNFHTEHGVCGAVVLAQNSHLQRKILGFHVAGSQSTNAGAAALVTQEVLADLLKLLPVDCKVKYSELVPQCLITKTIDAMKVVPEGNIELVGAVSENKAVRLPHKTEIEPSVIHGLVREPVTEPAVLTRNDPRNKSGESPLIKAISKYGKLTIPYQPSHRRLVKQDIMFDVLNWEKGMEARVLSDHEAAWGNDTIPYCERMNMKASPGYPWTLSRPSGEMGKAYLFDINSPDGIANEQYRYEYLAREKLAKAGIRKQSIWTDCLKDERRSKEKIQQGKTRAFMLPPADFVQLFRKYFMAFGVTFYHNHCNTFSAVGLDPYSFDWTRLSRRLRRKAKYFFGGDFHNFDGTLNPEIMWDIYETIEEWYKRNDPNWTEEDELVRQTLWIETMHTVHICLNSVYITHQGNPSGNPFTVIINTLYHASVMRLIYIEIMIMLGMIAMATMYHYRKYIVDVYYGDDGLVGVAKLIAELFNLLSVQERFKAHGIEYTAEDKKSTYTVRSLEECTFLKNGFVKLADSNFWLAPISEDTIYELTNWVHKSEDPVGQLRENIQTALRFAFHHGKQWYDRFGKVCAEACLARRVRPVSFSYEQALAEFVQKCTE